MRDVPRIRRAAFVPALATVLAGFLAVPALAGPPPRPTPATFAPALRISDGPSLEPPPVGAWDLRVVSPRFLQVTWINTAAPGRDPSTWDFVRDGAARLPPPASFRARVGDRVVAVEAVGFRRRPAFAAKGRRDLRIRNVLTLRLASPLPARGELHLGNPGKDVFSSPVEIAAPLDPMRPSTAIHVPHVGYATNGSKRAAVGTWTGTLGELPVPEDAGFQVVDAATGQVAFQGRLSRTHEQGFETAVPPYRQVREADFTPLDRPGAYRLRVAGLGASPPFPIDDGRPALLARTLALGLYHQRCGAALEAPFTRFTHDACHLAPAAIPRTGDRHFDARLAGLQQGRSPGDQKAPSLDSMDRALYPFSQEGPVDVRGGHHDAGDYSRYVTNSAALVHALVLATDAFPGVAELDNLGLPDSGDALPDLLQIAKWEADFLARMQDRDGGEFFLVYPRDRAYEDDVMPDRGDPQVVFPKNTSATAAAVAALAQAGSSPWMRRAFPDEAAGYLDKARKGWEFLEAAWRAHGRNGAYQHVTHYGNQFADSDEIAWAAVELWLATGEERFARVARDGFDPVDHSRTRRWGWVPLTEGYGNATRSCALAPRTGHPFATRLDRDLQARCRTELDRVGDELASWALASAWRVTFPLENKRFATAAWHFSPAYAFDLEVAALGRNRPDLHAFAESDFDYALGANPVDVCFLAGLGRNRPMNPVSQFAANDGRALPPTGLLVGDVTEGPSWTPDYQRDLGRLAFPPDGDRNTRDPYPMFDRWTDMWNVKAEATVVAQGQALAAAAAMMGRSALRGQPWRQATAWIGGLPARIVAGMAVTPRLEVQPSGPVARETAWEASGLSPRQGPAPTFVFPRPGPAWIEAEEVGLDGRRVFARADITVLPSGTSAPGD